jgi:hypothetical protein
MGHPLCGYTEWMGIERSETPFDPIPHVHFRTLDSETEHDASSIRAQDC